MKSLTKEQICAYLPYNVKSVMSASDFNINNLISTVNFSNAINFTEPGYSSKIILRPNNLTTPIEIAGELITPLKELFNLLIAKPSDIWLNIDGSVIGVRKDDYVLRHIEKTLFVFTCKGEPCNFDSLPLIKWLAANKFDFMGLIDEKLAVSVESLEKDPYD